MQYLTGQKKAWPWATLMPYMVTIRTLLEEPGAPSAVTPGGTQSTALGQMQSALRSVEDTMAAFLTVLEYGDPDATKWMVWPTEYPVAQLLLRCPHLM